MQHRLHSRSRPVRPVGCPALIVLLLALVLPGATPAAAVGDAPSLRAAPLVGPAGTIFAIKGFGFPARARIALSIPIGFEQGWSQELRADASGAFRTTFDSTGLKVGDYVVYADYSTAAPGLQAILKIIPLGLTYIPPAIGMLPPNGWVGTVFTARGEAYDRHAPLTVAVVGPGGFTRALSATADGVGDFSLAIDSTGFPLGAYTVTTTGPSARADQVPGHFDIVEGGPPAPGGGGGRRCFAETGKCAGGRFLAYWMDHGGLAINGFPISDEFAERLADGNLYTVQYFERTRLEYHPANTDPRYQVLLGQFGRLLHPPDPPVPPLSGGAQYFPSTGHNVGGRFAAYWTANGGLAQFGYPLSEVIRERLEDGKEYDVQYFERARLELHPENAAPYDVLLGQFGRRILGTR